MDDCTHTITQNDCCVKCGELVYATESRPCKDCLHFRLRNNNINICILKLMGITRNMHVYYKIKEGSCFKGHEENNGVEKIKISYLQFDNNIEDIYCNNEGENNKTEEVNEKI